MIMPKNCYATVRDFEYRIEKFPDDVDPGEFFKEIARVIAAWRAAIGGIRWHNRQVWYEKMSASGFIFRESDCCEELGKTVFILDGNLWDD